MNTITTFLKAFGLGLILAFGVDLAIGLCLGDRLESGLILAPALIVGYIAMVSVLD